MQKSGRRTFTAARNARIEAIGGKGIIVIEVPRVDRHIIRDGRENPAVEEVRPSKLADPNWPPKKACGSYHLQALIFRLVKLLLGILTLCQVVPMYAIYTFGPQIMTAFGLGVGKSAILGESVLSLFFLVGSLPAMFWLNSMGRRPLLIRSLFLIAVGLLALGLFPTAPFSR